ncbi:MAG TPA: hypothetical protein VMQ44_03530 [Candidatus Saccharimonadales bacterium]|nr:hypothetical protein [Candidatus Saccharimonadales bacterium]
MPEVLEQEPVEATKSPEQIISERRGQLLSHLEELGIAIDDEALSRFLPNIECQKTLENEPAAQKVKQEHGLDHLFALVNRDGSVVTSEKFLHLSEKRQAHTLYHELGHRLDWLGRGFDEQQDGYQELAALNALIRNLPPEQASRYTGEIAERLEKKGESNPEMLAREMTAELYAQYMEGDGSFKDFMQAKIETYSEDEVPPWLAYTEVEKLMNDLGDLEEADEDTRQLYLANNPIIAEHYQIHTALARVCQNEEIIDGMTEVSIEDEYDYLEYNELYEQIPDPKPQPAPNKKSLAAAIQSGQKKKDIGFWGSFFGF